MHVKGVTPVRPTKKSINNASPVQLLPQIPPTGVEMGAIVVVDALRSTPYELKINK